MKRTNCGPAPLTGVDDGSAAWLAGMRAGDSILRIDGMPLRDAIDVWMALADGGEHSLAIEHNGAIHDITVDTSSGPPGFELAKPVFGQLATCTNNCVFCFVDQLPEGLREELYVKDDDFRLSFMGGNFITLTNIEKDDIKRILEERLSPLYVSLHSTEPGVRKKLFVNPDAARALKALRMLLKAGIRVHVQIVLVRGINDAEHLDATLGDILEHYPEVATIGIVPVGVSRGGRKTLPESFAYDKEAAAAVLEQIERWRSAFGPGRLFAADEFFFMAGLQPPEADYYGEFEQLENGVGLARLARDSYAEASRAALPAGSLEDCALLTTPAGWWVLCPLGLEETGLEILVSENSLFGDRVNVCGLLPGKDVARALASSGARAAIIPGVALDESLRFIDGLALADVTEGRRISLFASPSTGEGLAKTLADVAGGLR